MRPKIAYLVPLLFFSYVFFGQITDSVKSTQKVHFISVKTQFSQFKDQFNYGLVYSGPNLGLGYSFVKTSGEKVISYKGDLAFGINFNKGTGVSLRIKPVDFFYGFRLNSAPIELGPYASANYIWQLYPDIQSGHMFWFTVWEIGPNMIVKIPFKSKTFTILFSNSLFGITSRPGPGTETTYYSLNLIDYIEYSHQDVKLGSFNNFNHSYLQLGLLNNNRKRFGLSYSFEYFGYYKDPKLGIIFHSLNFNFKLGKHHEN